MLNYSPEIEKGLCLFLHSFVSCEHFVIYLSHLAQAISTPTLIGSLFEFLKSCHCFRGDKDVNHTELKSFLQVRSKNYFFSLTFAHLAEHIVRAKGAHYARLFLTCQDRDAFFVFSNGFSTYSTQFVDKPPRPAGKYLKPRPIFRVPKI